MGRHTSDEVDVVEWRRLTPQLWVGADADGFVGCIEVGRRYVATDGEGRVFARCRRLADAKALLAELRDERPLGPLQQVA